MSFLIPRKYNSSHANSFKIEAPKTSVHFSTETFVIPALAAQCGKVWLTVSSLWRPIAASDKVVDAELEVNWDLDCPSSTGYPDTIKVFTADPAHSNKFCLLLLNVVTRGFKRLISFELVLRFIRIKSVIIHIQFCISERTG